MDEPRERQVGACPDSEDIASYLDGQLGPEQRAALQAHFADCASCRQLLAEVDHTLQPLPVSAMSLAPASAEPRRRPLWQWVVPIAAAAAVMLVALRVYAPGSPVSAELQGIVVAAGAVRPTPGRLTGGFAYSAQAPTVRSGDQGKALAPALRIAIARAEADLTNGRTPSRLHAFGVAMLLDGKHDAAVTALEEAASAAPSDASIASDLAAAYLARGKGANRPDDLSRGLAAVDTSIRLAREHGQSPPVEALFNRAMLLESLSLSAQAADAWREYLALDGDSSWATEAREHQKQLSAK